MPQWAEEVVARLAHVRRLRRERDSDPVLRANVEAIKQFQQARFRRDYVALLASPRYSAAATFFLEELYGPEDFATRDAEFERVVPLMARVLPPEVKRTVAALIELHSLTEELDQRMGAALSSADIGERSYRDAWQRVGRRPDREQQLALLLGCGRALDQHTRIKLLAATLRLMRGPAQAAGLGRLQGFLEVGMSAFSGMAGAQEFLRIIDENESRTINELFTNK